MKFKVGDEVRLSCYCERYEQDRIYGKAGYVIKIDERLMYPIAVKFEGIFNSKAKSGYFYFNENELIQIRRADNVDIIVFNEFLQDITDKYGLISSYRWSDNLDGYLYDFYRDHFTNKNRVARVIVKPDQLNDIYETLSNIDEHLAERLNPMPYQIKHFGRGNLSQEENQYIKQDIKFTNKMFDNLFKNKESNMLKGKIEKVIFNNPATIVFWTDGTKTVVKASNEKFDPEKGLAMAIAKKALGNEGNYFNEIKKWLPEDKSINMLAEAEEFVNNLTEILAKKILY